MGESEGGACAPGTAVTQDPPGCWSLMGTELMLPQAFGCTQLAAEKGAEDDGAKSLHHQAGVSAPRMWPAAVGTVLIPEAGQLRQSHGGANAAQPSWGGDREERELKCQRNPVGARLCSSLGVTAGPCFISLVRSPPVCKVGVRARRGVREGKLGGAVHRARLPGRARGQQLPTDTFLVVTTVIYHPHCRQQCHSVQSCFLVSPPGAVARSCWFSVYLFIHSFSRLLSPYSVPLMG